jgi:orotate phosphoribosyltransferase
MPSRESADNRERLQEIIREKSLRFGQFTLASGKTSSYYLDCRLTTLDPEGAYRTGLEVLRLLAEAGIEAEAIGGPTIGADPMVAAVAVCSYQQGRPLPAFLVRKEAKGHGTRRRIEGGLGPASKVVVVDDVVTTAGSTLMAIRACEEEGHEVVAVMCLVDRQEGGSEALADYRFLPLFTRDQLLEGTEGASTSR